MSTSARVLTASAVDGSRGGRRAFAPLDAPPLKEIYLHPGQTYASNEPTNISMILGSCVGVCLFDCRQSIGGATHYMLAEWHGSGQPSSRYGDVAIHTLVEQLQLRGSKISDLQAMVFGGACMFQALREKTGDHIGARNTRVALEILAHHAIAIVTRDTGGHNGRKLKMHSGTGAVFMTLIGNP